MASSESNNTGTVTSELNVDTPLNNSSTSSLPQEMQQSLQLDFQGVANANAPQQQLQQQQQQQQPDGSKFRPEATLVINQNAASVLNGNGNGASCGAGGKANETTGTTTSSTSSAAVAPTAPRNPGIASTTSESPSPKSNNGSPLAKRVKIKKRKGPRAQTVEEVFASISTVRSSGINPPPENIVLTPTSAEACLRCGVNPETLKIRDLDSFYDPDITPAVQRMRHEAYSLRRHEEMKAIRAEKNKILAANDAFGSPKAKVIAITTPKSANKGSPAVSKASSTSPNNGAGAYGSDCEQAGSSLVEIEKRRLEKIKLRQERELEQMIDFEMKMSRIQEQAAEQMERERRLQEQREREKLRRAQQMAEEKRQREIQKKAQHDAEEEKRRLLAANMAKKDREAAEEKAKEERLRKIEARHREEERKLKAEEHRLMTERILKQQQQQILERLKELDLAEKTRNEMMEAQRQERAQEMDAKRRFVALRIQKNLHQSRQVEQQRRQMIQKRQEITEQNRQEHEEQLEQQRILLHQQQQLMERKRQMVLEEFKQEERLRKARLIEKQTQMEQNVEQLQHTQQQQLFLKKESRKLQQQLKMDKVERMKRIQEFKRLETLKRLQQQEQRTNELLEQKDDLIRRRKQIAIQTKIQRDMILKTMDNVRITKKWKHATKTIEQIIGKGSPMSMDSMSPQKRRPQSSPGVVSHKGSPLPKLDDNGQQQANGPGKKRPMTPGSQARKQQQNQQHHEQQYSPPLPTKTAFKFTKEAQQAAKNNAQNNAATPQAYASPYDHIPPQLRTNKKKPQQTQSAVF